MVQRDGVNFEVPKTASPSSVRQHNYAVTDTWIDFACKKFLNPNVATYIVYDGTEDKTSSKNKYENFLIGGYDVDSEVVIRIPTIPHRYSTSTHDAESICIAFNESVVPLNVTHTCATIITDQATTTMTSFRKIVAQDCFPSKVVAHGVGTNHNVDNTVKYAGGFITGHLSVRDKISFNKQEENKFGGSWNTSAAFTICKLMGDKGYFPPQSDFLKTLKALLPHELRSQICFSPNADGRWCSTAPGMHVFTLLPKMMKTIGGILLQNYDPQISNSINHNYKVIGDSLCNQTFQISMYVEQLHVARLKLHEGWLYNLPFLGPLYGQEFAGVVAWSV